MANQGKQGAGREGKRPAHAHAKPSLWEIALAVLGGAIVVAALGFMVYEAVNAASDPVPQLVIRVDTVIAYPSGYVAEFRVSNSGDATAADVRVSGALRSDTGVVEQSEATIDFVPAQSWRLGGLVFQNDPRRYRLQVRPIGFDRP